MNRPGSVKLTWFGSDCFFHGVNFCGKPRKQSVIKFKRHKWETANWLAVGCCCLGINCFLNTDIFVDNIRITNPVLTFWISYSSSVVRSFEEFFNGSSKIDQSLTRLFFSRVFFQRNTKKSQRGVNTLKLVSLSCYCIFNVSERFFRCWLLSLFCPPNSCHGASLLTQRCHNH